MTQEITVGTKVYKTAPKGYIINGRPVAIELTITRMLKTKLVTSDGSEWPREYVWKSEQETFAYINGSKSSTPAWRAKTSNYNSARAAVLSTVNFDNLTVYTQAEFEAAIGALAAEKAAAEIAARAAKLAELGVREVARTAVKNTSGSFGAYGELRTIRKSLTEEQMVEYIEALEELAIEQARNIKDSVERMASFAERIADEAKKLMA